MALVLKVVVALGTQFSPTTAALMELRELLVLPVLAVSSFSCLFSESGIRNFTSD
jgi:hypothetical protein